MLKRPQPEVDPNDPDGQVLSTRLKRHVSYGERETMGIKCFLPPHPQIQFKDHEEFKAHYLKEHTHRCSECRKNFPTEHFLGLHTEENHDPLVEVRRAKYEKTVGDRRFVLRILSKLMYTSIVSMFCGIM